MTVGHRTRTSMLIVAVAIAIHAFPAAGAGVPAQLPDPDGKPADMSKPVKVFILMGQSNVEEDRWRVPVDVVRATAAEPRLGP